ncbi:MAG: hypothetical protein ABSE08_01775 [Syntrophobacteraceae bacterium]|jgi:hypothetical protein
MKLGFSGEAFGNLLIVSGVLGLITLGIVFFIAHKRGINIATRKFALSTGVGAAIVFAIIPLWLTNISIKFKVVGSALALAVGIGNYFAIDRAQRVLRDTVQEEIMNKELRHS